ncbi:MAG TPA: PAS domain S-box protein [Trichocoleus sp.]|jgi:PAS domain S-box-containing protein
MAKILIAEDERTVAWYLQRTLRNLGHSIVGIVDSGKAAVQLATEMQPELVLMDIRLSGDLDGIDAALQIGTSLNVPVVYLTAHIDDQTIKRAIATSPFGYLIKPVNQAELQTSVEVALRRYRMEADLKSTQQRLSTMLNSIGDGMIASDPAGRITFINPMAAHLTGWQQTEAIGQDANHVFRIVNAETGETVDNPLLKAIQQGMRVTLPDNCLLYTKQGMERFIGDTATPIQGKSGEIMGGVLVFQDITSRKQAEQFLHRREQEIRALVENSPDIISRFDRNLRYLYINPAVEQVIGIPPQTFLGKTNRELGIADFLTQLWDEALQQVFCIKQEQALEFDFPTPLGICSFHSRVVPEFDLDGNIESVLVVTRNISDLKQVQEELKNSAIALEKQMRERTDQLEQVLEFEALLKRITDNVRSSLDEPKILQTAVQELAQGLNVIRCYAGVYNADHTATTIRYDYTDGLPSLAGVTIAFAESSIPEIYPQLLQGQCSQFCLRMPDSVWAGGRSAALLVCPLVDSDIVGDLWLVKSADQGFSEIEIRLVQQVANQCAIALRQAELYQAAQAQVQELERLNQLKDDFLSTVSHELRTPITGIKMASEMLAFRLNQIGLSDDQAKRINRYLDILQNECNREMMLVNDLLDLTRLEAEVEPLRLTELDLPTWIPQLVDPFLDRLQRLEQHLSLALPETLPLIMTDPVMLMRVITELIDNACKYTPEREMIHITARYQSSQFQILVQNTGIEIPPQEQSRVFEKFYRIPNADPNRYKGTGLGLALVKKLMERLRGTIELESGDCQTCFIITIPSLTSFDLRQS